MGQDNFRPADTRRPYTQVRRTMTRGYGDANFPFPVHGSCVKISDY